ncbi:hypothetical protein H6F32_03250 [Anabaena sp. FACHB-1237]|uniref:hypothetical protein n=1 Tax=Anabaena sp. FACHB-1237 TaxID=2692769 RepID=UPI00167FFD99|nr:hypothetical protein [Anabaena sp. FACHB-1237]MBD2136625.1 hypothetical protein [Anabaena sp. FACHB-1237]
MPLFFLITIVTGVVTRYLLKRNNDEALNIAGVVTAIIFLLSLVFAPWQIQLGLLILVFVLSNKLLKKNFS